MNLLLPLCWILTHDWDYRTTTGRRPHYIISYKCSRCGQRKIKQVETDKE